MLFGDKRQTGIKANFLAEGFYIFYSQLEQTRNTKKYETNYGTIELSNIFFNLISL